MSEPDVDNGALDAEVETCQAPVSKVLHGEVPDLEKQLLAVLRLAQWIHAE